ncbi:MAG: sphingomyelin phosphodiesterase [bacterium]
MHLTPPHPSPRVLDLLSLNIWVRPWFLLDGRAARVDRLAGPLRGYDVVVLNEAFEQRICGRLYDALAEEYPHRTPVLGSASPPRPWGPALKLWNGGVVMLSRWPIERTDSRSFRDCLGPVDLWSDKGVLYACVNKQGRRYHVFGTHAQASSEGYIRLAFRLLGRDADAELDAHRLANYDVVRAFIDESSIPATEPVLIAGDLNCDRLTRPHRFEHALRRLNAGFPEELSGPPCTIDPGVNSLARSPHHEWLDYVLWSRSHLEPRRSRIDVRPMRSERPWRSHPLGRSHHDLSDHHAVLGRFEF